MAYLGAYKKAHQSEKIILVITKRDIELCEMFINLCDDVAIVSENKMIVLAETYLLREKVKLFKKFNVVDVFPFPEDRRFLGHFGITAHTMTKEICFGLPSYIQPQKPKIMPVNSNLYDNFCKHKKVVIISPYSYSAIQIVSQFWDDLVFWLHQKGYIVYTNLGPGQQAIRDTLALNCSFKELPAFADKAKFVIGLRSGMFDVIVSSRCKKVVIYNGKENRCIFLHYRLKDWGMDSKDLLEIEGSPKIDDITRFMTSCKE